MLKNIIFPRCGVPRYLIIDGGSHFIQSAFRKNLAKYDVNLPQTSSQVELTNREIKLIFAKDC